jgi:hypothetical protein
MGERLRGDWPASHEPSDDGYSLAMANVCELTRRGYPDVSLNKTIIKTQAPPILPFPRAALVSIQIDPHISTRQQAWKPVRRRRWHRRNRPGGGRRPGCRGCCPPRRAGSRGGAGHSSSDYGKQIQPTPPSGHMSTDAKMCNRNRQPLARRIVNTKAGLARPAFVSTSAYSRESVDNRLCHPYQLISLGVCDCFTPLRLDSIDKGLEAIDSGHIVMLIEVTDKLHHTLQFGI